MSEITTPTEAQILEAAESSPEAKLALSKLFPDVFKPKLVESEISYKYLATLSEKLNDFFKPVVSQLNKKLYFQFGDVYRGAIPFNRKGIILGHNDEDTIKFKIETNKHGFQILIPDVDS